MAAQSSYIMWFEELGNENVELVGGKNASLGEMIRSLKEQKVRIPDGFATTSEAYRRFLYANQLDNKIQSLIDSFQRGDKQLADVGRSIRDLFLQSEFPEEFSREIRENYRELSRRYGVKEADVAVRSSATAEDLPTASFAGQQETFLNISGEEQLLLSCKRCFASLFTDRAISYRTEKGFDHMKVALSVGIQKMVRSDLAGSGVMFTLDTDTGFPNVVMINAGWGLGETVVQGSITPDEYVVFKPLLDKPGKKPVVGLSMGEKARKMVYSGGGTSTTRTVDTSHHERSTFVLTNDEIITLARWATVIEKHYGKPMDLEWAKDGETNDIFIVQARPETVQSQKQPKSLKAYSLKQEGKRIAQGSAIGESIATGKAQMIRSPEQKDQFRDGSILITGMTDPDWVPIMKRASGIITDHGGRTSHAAIVSRELGIPAIVGTGSGTKDIPDKEEITLSCAEGKQGYVYEGTLEYEEREIDIEKLPTPPVDIMINIASPDSAFRWWQLPVKGIGLARMEFIINNAIKIHPMALAHYDSIQSEEDKALIDELTYTYEDKKQYFIDNLAYGIARIAASQHPEPVIVRMSDFKTNEYANLIGGKQFEPEEANPMLGFRGASRYYDDRYRDGFTLECLAMKKVRDEIGLDNVKVMIPFCRSIDEAKKVLEVMEGNGLKRGESNLEVYVMCEIPSNVVIAEKFSELFDGFSIGSNDLTQLVLGVDRDSAELKELFDERNDAVKEMVRMVIKKAHAAGRKVGICGEAPSNYPDFAEFLIREGIDSISLNPDSVIGVMEYTSKIEK
ncbi:phosphoenolpyruvate synthase [Chitinispirillales bacterium ANBcel5]|uniref:phosphoenolpyruvate synthase n=1 Tax=Cellulosispirillum alkaliphilum TaxID=3039283 RepID=UPI002A4E56CB|nr:phosphoenolpyruvate synthase [Chitinispirillales bacterium ANBcel5]